jgi:serine/threonine-protein kinase
MGLLIGGAGVLALGVGGFFGLRAISKNDDAKKYCPGGGHVCNEQTGVSLTGEAQDAARLANVFAIGGAIAAAGGAILFFTAPSDDKRRVGFFVDGHGASMMMKGAF